MEKVIPMKKKIFPLLLLAAVLSGCTMSNGKRHRRSTTTSETSNTSQTTSGPVEPTLRSISLNKTSLNFNLNTEHLYNSDDLSVIFDGEGDFDRGIIWSTSSSDIVSVGNGHVTALAIGNAVITATSNFNANITATCSVNVINDIPVVESVSINPNQATIDLYTSHETTLVATVNGTNNPSQKVDWSVEQGSDKVSVSDGGVVTASAEGSATIKATSVADTSKTATATINIIDKTPSVTNVDITKNGAKITGSTQKLDLYDKTTLQLGSLVEYKNDASQEVSWESSNTNKVTVSESGLLTAVETTVSPITITATSKFDTTKSAQINVTVNDSTPTVTKVSVTIDNTSPRLNQTTTAHVTVEDSPKDSVSDKSVKWSSSNTNIAKIDENTGVITPQSVGGPITITATSNYDQTQKGTAQLSVLEAGSLDAYTVMLYICGADLESGSWQDPEGGHASDDIQEILDATATKPSDVNIVIETGGANSWSSSYGLNIPSNKLARWHVDNKKLVKDEELSTYTSMGLSSTLQSFIEYGIENYPADKMAFIFWNHGNGLQGCCFDEKTSNDDCLTPIEIDTAFSEAFKNKSFSGKFEWIGYDCCLKQHLEDAYINSKYANYHIASQISEDGDGWNYTPWINALYQNKNIATGTLLTMICDEFVKQYGATDLGNTQTLSWLQLGNVQAFVDEFNSFTADQNITAHNNAGKNAKNSTIAFESSLGCYDLGNALKYWNAPTSVTNALNNLVGYTKYVNNAQDDYDISYKTYKPSGVNIFIGSSSYISPTYYKSVASFLTTYKS